MVHVLEVISIMRKPSEQNRQKSSQKRTPSDCFFGDFSHWVILRLSTRSLTFHLSMVDK